MPKRPDVFAIFRRVAEVSFCSTSAGGAAAVFCATMLVFAGSFVGSRVPSLGWSIGGALCLLLVFLFTRSFPAGVLFVFAELVAGSLGHLFVFPRGVSIRMVFFAIALVATALRLFRSEEDRLFVRKNVLRPEVLFLGVAVVYGFFRGLLSQPFGHVVGDANAYAFFLLLPTFLLAFKDISTRERVIPVLLGATSATAVLTLVLLFLFTQNTPEPILRMLYKWVRDFGLGEITRAPGGFYRVFFQAHIWNFILYLWSAALLVRAPKQRWLWIPAMLSAAVVFVSFSRTFWLSAALAMAIGILVVVSLRTTRPLFFRYVLFAFLVSALGIALPFALTRSVSSAAVARAGAIGGEAAIDSRFNLLPVMMGAIGEHPLLGSGFGKSLTYVTKDPRLLAYFPDGNYTTTAFEWGWLDFWIKMGIAGFLAFAVFVLVIVKKMWQMLAAAETSWLALAFFLSITGVALAHTFSPWLNHPLGIGLLLFLSGWSAVPDTARKTA
jgi:O-antigen ligase